MLEKKIDADFICNFQHSPTTLSFTPKVIVVDEVKKIYWQAQDIVSVEEASGIKLVHKNGDILSIKDAENLLPLLKKMYKNAKCFNPKFYWLYNNGFHISIVLSVFFFVCVFIIGLWLLNLNLYRIVSYEKEKKIGEITFNTTIKNYTIKDSSTFYMQKFIDEVNFDSNYKIKVVVTKSQELNAFALPGGYMVVYDSMVRMTESYEELAAILAHEFSHVQLRHSLQSVCNQLGWAIIFNVLIGDYGMLADLVLNLKNLKYSRNLENEADANAAILLEKKGIDVEALTISFKKMQRKFSRQNVPDYFSTHPNFEDRIKNVAAWALKNNNTKIHVQNMITLEKIYQKLKNQEKIK